mmetsp:Transcript_14425/g.28179  ORF Transcript_14425/g.28179 Transcript_14425/m.28179 type:complete len:688 (+) Transcript_14425:99-2162(+)
MEDNTPVNCEEKTAVTWGGGKPSEAPTETPSSLPSSTQTSSSGDHDVKSTKSKSPKKPQIHIPGLNYGFKAPVNSRVAAHLYTPPNQSEKPWTPIKRAGYDNSRSPKGNVRNPSLANLPGQKYQQTRPSSAARPPRVFQSPKLASQRPASADPSKRHQHGNFFGDNAGAPSDSARVSKMNVRSRQQFIVSGRFCVTHPLGNIFCRACLDGGLSEVEKRQRNLLLERFRVTRSEYPTRLSAEPIDVAALIDDFRLKDSDRLALIGKQQLVKLLTDNGLSRAKADTYASGFFRVTDKQFLGTLTFQDFLQEYCRMHIYRCLRSLQTPKEIRRDLMLQETLEGRTVMRSEVEGAFCTVLGRQIGTYYCADLFKTMDAEQRDSLTLLEVMTWYFDREELYRFTRESVYAQRVVARECEVAGMAVGDLTVGISRSSSRATIGRPNSSSSSGLNSHNPLGSRPSSAAASRQNTPATPTRSRQTAPEDNIAGALTASPGIQPQLKHSGSAKSLQSSVLSTMQQVPQSNLHANWQNGVNAFTINGGWKTEGYHAMDPSNKTNSHLPWSTETMIRNGPPSAFVSPIRFANIQRLNSHTLTRRPVGSRGSATDASASNNRPTSTAPAFLSRSSSATSLHSASSASLSHQLAVTQQLQQMALDPGPAHYENFAVGRVDKPTRFYNNGSEETPDEGDTS